MQKLNLTSSLLGSQFLTDGVISASDGSYWKGYVTDPLHSGELEESFDGPNAESAFTKLSELLSRLPNRFEGHIILNRQAHYDDVENNHEKDELDRYRTRLYIFEKIQKPESYSHIHALASELKMNPIPLDSPNWLELLSQFLGDKLQNDQLPDIVWEKDFVRINKNVVRTLSLTELPQVTWKGCLQPIFEYPGELVLSLKFAIPDRVKIKKQLETKRRVSHALSITSSLEVRNIESNSVLHSSEETLERILVGKETLFEMSLGIVLFGSETRTLAISQDLERVISGIGNAGLFLEGLGTLPVLKSHLPGNKTLGIRKLAILSENLAQLLPLFHDYSRRNDPSALKLCSRTGEVSHLNLFSKENLNYNSFICGASGSGKSFLMNAILSSLITDDANTRLCIFDVGGSYRRIIESSGGKSISLNTREAISLIATFLKEHPISERGFYRTLIETLCGSGSHITHSHRVAIDDLLKQHEGEALHISNMIQSASERTERFYQDIAHWLKPHRAIDKVPSRPDLLSLIRAPVAAFDFKELDSDPVLQKTTILLLSELLWTDLASGRHTRTLIVFDEVWRFFAQSKGFLEEMYRTLRKYKAGIVSITQNLADYGDEAFAKMLFTNSFTKIFLQNGASADYLRATFDLPASDITRALSVTSRKPHYSEFFALTPLMSQVFRLYPTAKFYELANTERVIGIPVYENRTPASRHSLSPSVLNLGGSEKKDFRFSDVK